MCFGANQISFEVLFENVVCTLRNSFIGPFLKNPWIGYCLDARWSGKRKFSKTKKLNYFHRLYWTQTWDLEVKYEKRSLVPGTCCTYVSSFCPYTLNCDDWYSLDLGTFDLFLTKTTITFVSLANFWVEQTHPLLYPFLEW